MVNTIDLVLMKQRSQVITEFPGRNIIASKGLFNNNTIPASERCIEKTRDILNGILTVDEVVPNGDGGFYTLYL